MNHSPRFWLLRLVGVVLVQAALIIHAAVELKPGMTVEFASVAEGQQILAERETGFITSMSQFDRCVRI